MTFYATKHNKALASVDKKRETKQCLPVASVQGNRQIQEVGWTHGERKAQHYNKGKGAKLPSRDQGQGLWSEGQGSKAS